jgi:hypothetical protein
MDLNNASENDRRVLARTFDDAIEAARGEGRYEGRQMAFEEAATLLDERARMHHQTANLGQPGYSIAGVALGNVAAELRALLETARAT